jgi:PKD repeat protein
MPKCPICGAENPEGKKYCRDCGSLISQSQKEFVQTEASDAKGQPHLESSNVGHSLRVKVLVIAMILIVAGVLTYCYQPVMGKISASTTTIDAGQSVRFSFTSTLGIPPFSYSWIFGDGGNGTGKNPTHIYASEGSFRATLRVVDGAGVSGSWHITIKVNNRPTVSARASTTLGVGVQTLQVTFAAVGVGGTPGYIYYWQFGDGGSSNEQSPIHTYSTGTYNARVVVTDSVGVSASWTTTVTVRQPLVFIDFVVVNYQSVGNVTLSPSLNYNMWVDSVQVVSQGAQNGSYIIALPPGTQHTIQVQLEFNLFADDKGPVMTTSTTVDLHCFLWYSTYNHSFVLDHSVTTFYCLSE